MLDQDLEPPAVSQVDSPRANSASSPIFSALIVSAGFLACWLLQILSPDNQAIAPDLPATNLTLLILAAACALYYNHKIKSNSPCWSTSSCLTVFCFSSLLPFAALLLPISNLHYAGSPADNLYICALLCLVPAFNTLSLIGLRQQILSRETGMALCSSAAVIAAITALLSGNTIAQGHSPIGWGAGGGHQSLVLAALCYGNLSGGIAALLIFSNYRRLPVLKKHSRLSLICAILAALSFLCEFRSASIARAEADLYQAPQQQNREQALQTLTMLGAAGDIEAALPARAISFFAVLPEDEQEKLHRLALFRLTGKLPAMTADNGKSDSRNRRQKNACKYIAANTPGYLGNAKDLSLDSSRLTAVVDSKTLTASMSWDMTIKNSSYNTEEAVLNMALPPGACVNAATLWVNDQPQEAAFAGNFQAMRAYSQVAQSRRDPLLVYSPQPGFVEIKVAPVSAGSSVRLRLGMALPLSLPLSLNTSPSPAQLNLPSIIGANTALHNTTVQIRTDKPLTNSGAKLPAEFSLSNEELSQFTADLSGCKLSDFTPFLTGATHTEEDCPAYIEGRLEAVARQPITHLHILLDDSLTVFQNKDKIAAAISAIPAGLPLSLAKASQSSRRRRLDWQRVVSKADLMEEIELLRPTGGPDNEPALLQSLQSLSNEPNSALLWIHGAQPVSKLAAEDLPPFSGQIDARRQFIDCNLSDGTNDLLYGALMHRYPALRISSSLPSLENQAQFWIEKTRSGSTRQLHLQRLEKLHVYSEPILISSDPGLMDRASSLWALQQTMTLLGQQKGQTAARLARAYRLVTPVSAAVVLESRSDYALYGLDQDSTRGYHYQTSQNSNHDNAGPGDSSRYAISYTAAASIFADNNREDYMVNNANANQELPILYGATNGSGAPSLQGAVNATINGVNTAGTVTTNYGQSSTNIFIATVLLLVYCTGLGGFILWLKGAFTRCPSPEENAVLIYQADSLMTLACLLGCLLQIPYS